MRLLIAHLEAKSEERYWRVYISEQMWLLNAAMRKEWNYPHFTDLIESAGKRDVQRDRDELERKQVYEWLMGGG